MLKLKNIKLKLPNFTLDNINLDIAERDFFAILGPTGSGKTLLLETIMGLRIPNSGQIVLDGIEITDFPPEKRKIGLVYQYFGLFPHMTVRDNILYGTRYIKDSVKNIDIKFEKLTETLSINHLLDRYPQNLSGGEKQRVALARVLILDTKVILLDEPLSALDHSSKDDIRKFLKTLHKSFEVTLIMVSHDFSDILYLANNGVLINKGQIAQQGSIKDIFHYPNSHFAAKFVGIKNVFPVNIKKNKIEINENIKLLIAPETKVSNQSFAAIRPEEIELVNSQNLTENCFEGEIVNISPEGFFVSVTICIHEVDFKLTTTRKNVTRNSLDIGDIVKISIPTESIHLF